MRPIDADAMHKFVEEKVAEGKGGFANGVPYEWAYALTAVDMQPTLDYAPVKHGHYGFVVGSATWVCVTFGTCSECKERVAWYRHNNYCPNCGAKMDRKE